MKILKGITALLAAGTITAAALAAPPADSSQNGPAEARSALQAGEAMKALNLLQSSPKWGANAAETHNLVCRARFMLGQWSAAAKACSQAVQLDRQNSEYHLWLGRALGQEASVAPFWAAYSLAKQTRVEFETAVRLNPRNQDALSDLGEFYVDAPSIVGGGLDKAESVADELDRVDRSDAAELRGRIAAARKDYGTTERYFKQAIALSAHPAVEWASLASFYRHQKQWTQMEWAVRNCAAAAARDRDPGVALYNGASVLIQAKQNPQLAARMLEDYLKSPMSEQGPAFQAHLWLAALKAQSGDTRGAQEEQATARTLTGELLPLRSSGN